MKPTILKTLALIIASIGFAGAAQSQSSTNELQVSAQASLLLTATNSPRIFLTVQLVNTSDHELTVLTKNLNGGIFMPYDKLVLSMGYSGSVGYKEHRLIPSLYDFSPVTLRPNEAAFIKREITNNEWFGAPSKISKALDDLFGKRNDMPLIVEYLSLFRMGQTVRSLERYRSNAPFQSLHQEMMRNAPWKDERA